MTELDEAATVSMLCDIVGLNPIDLTPEQKKHIAALIGQAYKAGELRGRIEEYRYFQQDNGDVNVYKEQIDERIRELSSERVKK